VYPDVEELFSYDYAGNRIYRKKGSLETTYSYDTRNRLIEKIEGSEQTRYSYDSNGNLITESGKQGTISYTYDCFNRTERVRKSNGEYIRNFYDPEGFRSKIEENGRTAWFVYSGRDIVAELDGEKLRAASIRGHELLMQRDGSGGQYYYLNNAHGDVEAMIDPSGVVANRYRYDAFGNIVEAKERVHNRFKYAGEQYDEVTGQYYLRARFYNPVVGSFTQEDVYRGDGLNLYAYVGNNPINYVDPSGYVCEQKYNLYKQFRDQGMTPKQANEQATIAMEKLKNSTRPDFYVTPSGDVIPATGYRYMSSTNATDALTTGKQYTTYIGFNKYDSAAAARDAFQVAPVWSDCKVRGTFDTLQVIDDMYVPTTLGNTTNIPEPFTVSYPQYGSGGEQQFRVDKVVEFIKVEIIGD